MPAYITEAEMDQPDMSEPQLGQAKVFRSVWQAPNLTKAGLADLIGFRSAEFQPVPNTASFLNPLSFLLNTAGENHDDLPLTPHRGNDVAG
jgi:hypothetical protein